MALRNQPYIPLYVQDFLTDEKLLECSSSSIGIYIMIMCVMHKSKDYGTILLKQKNKQSDNQINNFACKLGKHLPFTTTEIQAALTELINEDVLQLENDILSQKRMIHDNELSIKRSIAGKIGGEKTQFAKAKVKASPESEVENVIEDYIKDNCNGFANELKEWISFLEKKYDNETNIIQIESWLRLLNSWYSTNEQKKECLNKHISSKWKTLNNVKVNKEDLSDVEKIKKLM